MTPFTPTPLVIKVQPDVELNEGQTNALNGLVNWVFDRNGNFFATLDGCAGTGKTFLLNLFLKQIKARNFWGIVVTAPTHKAKSIVGKVTEETAGTIQGLLGLKPDLELDTFNINDLQFNKQGESEIRYQRLIIIDESSMLNRALFEAICKEASHYKVKVLFVGDEYQLPPVKEVISPVFTNVPTIFRLDEIVRQKNTNPIAELLGILRDDMKNRTENYKAFLESHTSSVNPETEEGFTVTTDKDEFSRQLVDHFNSAEFLNNPDYCRYTAWTNDSISFANKFIRDAIYQERAETPLIKGEILMAYNNVKNGKVNLLTNSDEYIVENVTFDYNLHGYKGYNTTLSPIGGGTIHVFIVASESYQTFLKDQQDHLNLAIAKRGRQWVEYFKFKNAHLLLEPIKFSNNTLAVKKDLDYGYGITVHKTQGSTYNTIFVNGGNINRNNDQMERLKLWYVALSRCSKKAIILL